MTKSIYHSLKGLALAGISLCTFNTLYAQTLEMGSTGASTTTTGPLATQSITLFENGTTAYTPTTTVTYTLSNQQYGPGTVEGLATYNAANFGVTGPATQNNTTPDLVPAYNLMNFIGSPLDNMFTACPTCTPGTGIEVANNYAAELMIFTDALITATTTNKVAVNSKVYMADLTLTFNRPVSNPVIQLAGLGGQRSSTSGTGITYGLGFSAEYELMNTQYTLTKLSGTTTLAVSGLNITNTATYLGSSSQGTAAQGITRTGASGSVVVNGTNITTLTFRVYLRGDGGRITNAANTVVAAESAAWYPAWSLGATNAGGVTGTITGEATTFGVSLLKPVTISGNVFRDKDGGNVNNSSGSANNIATGLYANLISAAGTVVASVAVPATGVYSFAGIGAGTYTMRISTTQGTQGAAAPAVVLPTNWVSTGEFNGTPNTGNDATPNGISASFTVEATDVSNINFGIQQRSTANVVSQNIATPVGLAITPGTLTTAVTGTDPEDGSYTSTPGPVTVIIDTLPTNAVMRYSGAIVTAGTSFANFNPALVSFTAISAGSTSTRFVYSFVDAAGTKGNPARYNVIWTTPLPLNLVSFTAQTNQCSATVNWVTNNEQNIRHFIVEQSTDGLSYYNATAPVAAQNNPQETRYSSVIEDTKGNSYFRLAIYEGDGQINYSNVVKVASDCNHNGIGTWTAAPNPVMAGNAINLNYTQAYTTGPVQISVYNTLGQKVYEGAYTIDHTAGIINLDKVRLAAGSYVIHINNEQAQQTIQVSVQ